MTEDEIIAEVARGAWHDRGVGDCPTEAIPAPDELAQWLKKAPEASRAQANKRLSAVLNRPALWASINEHGEGRRLFALEECIAGHDLVVWMRLGDVVSVHRAWTAADDRALHPLGPLVRAWQDRPQEVEPFRPRQRANLPALHRSRREDLSALPILPTETREPAFLPGLEPTVGGCPSWLLALFDQAGGQSMRRRASGASWVLRFFVAALLHLPIEYRDGRPRDLGFMVAEVDAWLHPRGWHRANRRRDWPKFLEALASLGTLRVPMEVSACWPDDGTTEIREVALVACTDIPREWRNGKARVTFTVRAPGSEGPGIRLNWPRLVAYGTESAPLYRAYLAVSAAMHRTARRGVPLPKLIAAPVLGDDGQPKRRKGGSIVRSAAGGMVSHPMAHMAPMWTDADAARFIGLDPKHRENRARARRALDRLHRDGVIEVERTARGVRLYGPDGRVVGQVGDART